MNYDLERKVKVEVDGKIEYRNLAYVEYDSVFRRLVPVLASNEQAVWTIDGRCIVYKNGD